MDPVRSRFLPMEALLGVDCAVSPGRLCRGLGTQPLAFRAALAIGAHEQPVTQTESPMLARIPCFRRLGGVVAFRFPRRTGTGRRLNGLWAVLGLEFGGGVRPKRQGILPPSFAVACLHGHNASIQVE